MTVSAPPVAAIPRDPTIKLERYTMRLGYWIWMVTRDSLLPNLFK